jgi:hypothetical protein
MEDLGYDVPRHGRVTDADAERYGIFLFRDITMTSKRNGAAYVTYGIAGDGSTPMTQAGYRAALRLSRRCIQETSGIPDDVRFEWGTQSNRAGGDSHLFESGVLADERRAIGVWADADTEVGYLRLRIRARFAKMRRFGI